MRELIIPIVGISVLFFASSLRAETTSDAIVEMRGFQVDFHLASERDRKLVLRSLDEQLEIVEATKVPPSVMEFFRTVPIVVDPALTAMNGEYRQQDGRWIVRMKPTKLPGDRPIALHELLHAYHHQVLKQPTPQVGRAFQHAQQSKIYPDRYRDAHFLENGKEYFAVIASIYLLDKKIDQPPFDCSIPAKTQPEFIAFLAELFGPRECR